LGPRQIILRRRTFIAVLLWVGCLLPHLQAAGYGDLPAGSPAEQLRRQAQQSERDGQWDKAFDLWQQLLSKDRSLADAREHSQYCFRRGQQNRRLHDATYRQQFLALSLPEALQVYGEVLSKLHASYVDRDKVEFTLLFKQGIEELRLALGDKVLRRDYLGGIGVAAVREFQTQLRETWGGKTVRRLTDAQDLAREVALTAEKSLRLNASLVVLELACGACSNLDEYTYYVTPGQFNELNASWKGEFVGVGIEVSLENNKLVIAQVVPGSSAQAAGLREHDRITRIGKQPTRNMTAEAAGELLKGEPDSILELEVVSPGDRQPQVRKLKRQVVHVPSVSEPRFLDERLGVAYLQIISFQETTVPELDVAVAKLQSAGMRVLIIDLRGNLGGLFETALQVTERFLSSGVIVCTQGQSTEYNRIYQAHGMNSLAVPLVVLVDGETASSAEMLAGALKENQRGKLVGRTTFGKGSIQKVRRLDSTPAAVRMTVAKFFSPRGNAYSAGITPDVDVPRSEMPLMDPDQDPQVQTALDVARSLALGQ
jgi:carboxyl-terminal processing protease